MTNYIFSTGSARGGTGLVTRMLSVSPVVEIALDPCVDLFRSFRSAVVRQCSSEKLKQSYVSNAPLDDYYFSATDVKLLDMIQDADFSFPFCCDEWPSLLEFLKKRAVLSSADLVPVMAEIQGKTYKAMVENCLTLIQKRKHAQRLHWTGIHENWTVEFLPALARTFPYAKFFIILRDPRAVVSSNLKVSDASKRGHALSYARCLRKLMACAIHYQSLPLFQGRLYVVRHEDVLTSPEKTCRELCRFLEIDFIDDMLDTNKYIEPSTGGVYNGFSSFETQASGISTHRIDRWRQHLSEAQVALVDFVCGPEMKCFGYQPHHDFEKESLRKLALCALTDDLRGEKSWRVDYGSIQEDFGFELFRYALLSYGIGFNDALTIRQSFLFESVFRELCHKISETSTTSTKGGFL